ncbi:PREDICTED: MKI67 FHA domain-interacting nucleolar phosphoprotein [Gavialis gangeticus]|uniref:MKI67 FHA domain-interacting nucleolar phosphoprotein n=1 Tax=Gavialis gangeticus TaxID=94835 RepID=UPI00092FC880|nr:PREDICTED: MKI67 FHA domain-interacting nucleolar phosphoprotein [Gavialis gangeticus]XP_019378136.1 PREDICTED: MKI67 FHA domain-interacting nucleolar phosphoprotein [Gavialis gangeticus]
MEVVAAGAGAAAAAPAALLSLDPQLQRQFQAKVQRVRAAKHERLTPGVVYLGHIPKGLYEPQLREYFSQFGTVTRLRLARSKKTGSSKGYAFVEFESDDVAKIVADTMNNYLFCERLLKCQFMPPEKVHENLFKGSETNFRKPSRPAVKRYNKQRSLKDKKKMTERLLRKERMLRKRLAEKGIDYDFPGFAAAIPRQKRKKVSKSNSKLNISVNSQDPTPVCTPTVLSRRKSQPQESDLDDSEITIKLPPPSVSARPKRTPAKRKGNLKKKK